MSRIELHNLLVSMFENANVYYQPPENVKMEYPCIRYSKTKIDIKHANNSAYLKNNRYELIVMSKMPDNPVIEKLLELPYCSFDRHYVANGLNHDVLILYF